MNYCKSFENLIDNLAKLPGVGRKSAERMAYAILEFDNFNVEEFTNAFKNAKSNIKKCQICGNITENDICEVCSDESRDHSIVCVVQSPKDAFNIDKSNSYKGVYHILNGAINPINGIGVDELNIDSLLKNIQKGIIKEVIIATNPTTEGETTALYLSKILEKYNVTVSRIAYGVPLGGSLDYTDEYTISKAIEGRRTYKNK